MVQIDDIHIFKNQVCPYGGLRLFWSGDVGFGQYDIVLESRNDEDDPTLNYKLKITGYSEGMDNNNDKAFLKELFESMLKQIEISE